MIGSILTLGLALLFAAGPVLFPGFNGFPPDIFPIPQTDPPVQPAGYAFAIWGLIYLWLVVGAAWGLWQRRDDPEWTRMRQPLNLSLALGAVWLPVAQVAPLAATVLIWAMWLSGLLALYRAPRRDRGFAAWPVGLYAGWLGAASCVALGLVLAGHGVTGERIAALAMIALAICLTAGVQLSLRRTPTLGLAVVWALTAVYVANTPDPADVAGIALGGAIGIGALTLLNLVQDLRRMV